MSPILRSLAVLCLLHAATAWSAAARITVSFDDTVTVEREQLTLGDIARISGDEPMRSQLRELAIGSAPRAGLTRRFEREALAALVRERLGRVSAVEWTGAEETIVQRAAVVHPADRFVEPAREALERHVRGRYAGLTRVDAVPVALTKPVTLPKGELSLTVRPLRGETLSKRVCVWVDVRVNGVAATSLPIWFAVNAYRPAMVAVRSLARHDRLNGGDLRVEERDIAGLSAEAVAADTVVASWRARQPIMAGQVLLKSDVEPAPSVSRNQAIQVHVVSGGVVIETSGIAMQEGRVGDRVAVRNPDSQKEYLAKIISEGVVMVSAQ